MHTAIAIAFAASETATGAGVPWYGKLIAGVIAVVLGIGIAYGQKSDKISLGDFSDLLGWIGWVFIVGGGAVIAWSIGAFN